MPITLQCMSSIEDIRSSQNVQTLTDIAHHPKVKKHITDDFTFGFTYDPGTLYLVWDDKGFVSAKPLSMICYQVHIALTPELWGKGEKIVSAAINWIFTNTACMKLVVIVPEYNKLAILVTKRFGKQEGVITKSVSKGLKLYDQIVFGLTKEEWVWKQQPEYS